MQTLRLIWRQIFVLTALMFTSSCGQFWQFAHDEKISGPYRLQAVDTINQLAVNYADGDGAVERIPPTVFSYGYNDNYIVAATYKYNQFKDIGHEVDRKIKNYYYIIRKIDFSRAKSDDGVRGPLDHQTYTIISQKLHLPPLNHDTSDIK